jgi:hypothetical protein
MLQPLGNAQPRIMRQTSKIWGTLRMREVMALALPALILPIASIGGIVSGMAVKVHRQEVVRQSSRCRAPDGAQPLG